MTRLISALSVFQNVGIDKGDIPDLAKVRLLEKKKKE